MNQYFTAMLSGRKLEKSRGSTGAGNLKDMGKHSCRVFIYCVTPHSGNVFFFLFTFPISSLCMKFLYHDHLCHVGSCSSNALTSLVRALLHPVESTSGSHDLQMVCELMLKFLVECIYLISYVFFFSASDEHSASSSVVSRAGQSANLLELQ